VAAADPDRLDAARAAVERTVEAFDAACSGFRPGSELSGLNAAAGSLVAVGPVLRDAVAAALQAAELTDGDVDPTVGTALTARGYDGASVSFAAEPGWRSVWLDGSVVRLAPGVALDLGATAKALAADRAAAAAVTDAGCGVLVSLLGDIAAAGEPPAGGWVVRVTDDHRAGASAPGQSITIAGGGLATSSTVARGGHILDPRTGGPVAGRWRTVTVAASTCLDANTASTAAMVRGGAAVRWLTSLGLAARLVTGDGFVTHVGGWPAEGEELDR
jgi:thiamine biosynthesis lipoprotein